MKEKKQKLKTLVRVLLLCVISLIIGITVYSWNAKTLAGNTMPMPFGFGMSVVLSGSMEPELSMNDLVIVREADSCAVDDIVVYQDGNSLVIHRIWSVDGETVITKGDANNAVDEPIKTSVIKGKVVAHIPFVGAIVRFLKTSVGTMLLVVAAIVFFELPYLQKRKQAEDEKEKIREEIRKLKGE